MRLKMLHCYYTCAQRNSRLESVQNADIVNVCTHPARALNKGCASFSCGYSKPSSIIFLFTTYCHHKAQTSPVQMYQSNTTGSSAVWFACWLALLGQQENSKTSIQDSLSVRSPTPRSTLLTIIFTCLEIHHFLSGLPYPLHHHCQLYQIKQLKQLKIDMWCS